MSQNNATVNNENANVNANVNAAAAENNQTQAAPAPKVPFSVRHPKLHGFLKGIPGAVLQAGKKLIGGIAVIAGGIAVGELFLNLIDKPKTYGTLTLGDDLSLTDTADTAESFTSSNDNVVEPDVTEQATPFDI